MRRSFNVSKTTFRKIKLLLVLVLFVPVLPVTGCTPQAKPLLQTSDSVDELPGTEKRSIHIAALSQEVADLERLARLWENRTRNMSISDYPIGPGDVLEILVPAMEELRRITLRVSGDQTVSLPFIGVVWAGGLTEKELEEEIKCRLEEDTMYNPQVSVFVREYRSRQVAVTGPVHRPGLYSLTALFCPRKATNLSVFYDALSAKIASARKRGKKFSQSVFFIDKNKYRSKMAKRSSTIFKPSAF